MLKRLLKAQRGFTLIELMIVVSIVGILAAIAAPNYQWGLIRARESVLREDLYTFRSTIDQYYADQGKYPDSLQEMADKKYLKSVPVDPFTKNNSSWVVLPPPTTEGQDIKGNVYDVHSGSDQKSPDGTAYNEW
jgi:general secretion pathway protein G